MDPTLTRTMTSFCFISMLITGAGGFAALTMPAEAAQAVASSEGSFASFLVESVDRHPLVREAAAEVDGGQARFRAALGERLPTVSATADYNYGENTSDSIFRQEIDGQGSTLSVRADQLITDFGATRARIRSQKSELTSQRAQLSSVEQEILLQILVATVRIAEREDRVSFATSAVEAFDSTLAMEDQRFRAGRGGSTDALQARSRREGALARQARERGDLLKARNEFRAATGRLAPQQAIEVPQIDLPERLPANLQEAITIALDSNPDIAAAEARADAAEFVWYEEKRDGLLPRLEAYAEYRRDEDMDGFIGTVEDQRAGLQLTYRFNTGLSDVRNAQASRARARAQEQRVGEVRRQVERRVEQAWIDFTTAEQQARFLSRQVESAAQFLERAQREREIGGSNRRQLLDILTAETSLLNARSELESARSAYKQAAYRLLREMGTLQVDAVVYREGVNWPPRN